MATAAWVAHCATQRRGGQEGQGVGCARLLTAALEDGAFLNNWVSGLFGGAPEKYGAVDDPADQMSMTPLCLAAEPRFTMKLGVQGCGAETVRHLLQKGANADARRPSNGVSACYYAVKYGDLETLRVLAEEGGADLEVRNDKGSGLLFAAAQDGKVEVLEYLISRGVSTFGFRETILLGSPGDPVEVWHTASEAEQLLHPLRFPTSWRPPFAPPSLARYVECGLLLVQAAGWQTLRADALALVGVLHRIGDALGCDAVYPRAFARALLGVQVPLKRPPLNSQPPPQRVEPSAITKFAVAVTSGQRALSDQESGKQFRPFDAPTPERTGPRAMTDHQIAVECEANGIVAAWLADDQADDDARTRAAVEALQRDDDDFVAYGRTRVSVGSGQMVSYATGEAEPVQGPSSGTLCSVDTASTGNVASRDLSEVAMTLSRGPLVLPVSVNGLPVLAFLSSTSAYTVVSKHFADAAGLTYEPLRRRHGIEPFRSGNCSLLRSLPVELAVEGGQQKTRCIDVATAVVVDGTPRGLQLGLDFCSRAAVWFQLDVFIGTNPNCGRVSPDQKEQPRVQTEQLCQLRPTHLRPDFNRLASDSDTRGESIRIHFEDGASFISTPLHCVDVEGGYLAKVSIAKDIRLDVCSWCARGFTGMLTCSLCKRAGGEEPSAVRYCSAECQKKDWADHRREFHPDEEARYRARRAARRTRTSSQETTTA